MKKFAVLMQKRGYRVEVMDFINPQNSTVCYEPLDYLCSEEDIKNFASNLVGTAGTRNIEAYWYEAAVNVISVEILLIMKNAEYAGKKAKFTDVIRLHQSWRLYGGELAYTTLDVFVKLAQQMYPETNIRQLYSVLSGIAPKTASCILSIVNNAYSSTFTESVLKNIRRGNTFNIEEMGQKKTVLFVLSSAMNKAAHRFINLFYVQVFKSLFEYAEKLDTGRMPRPVHVLCDDFCCGCVIKDMDSYISIMRSTGIDVFLLIQSEAQLRALYGDYGRYADIPESVMPAGGEEWYFLDNPEATYTWYDRIVANVYADYNRTQTIASFSYPTNDATGMNLIAAQDNTGIGIVTYNGQYAIVYYDMLTTNPGPDDR